ncbi:MAG: YbaK/EbsC family protein, partial [Acidimicrobiia bacterium]
IGIAALRAVDRADYRRISDAFGIRRSDLQRADPEGLREILGMEPGSVAPIPLPGAVVIVDNQVESLPTVVCGTGIRTSSLEIQGSVFREFKIGTFADLRKISR